MTGHGPGECDEVNVAGRENVTAPRSLVRYADWFSQGASTLIRPRLPYDDFSCVTSAVAAMTPEALLVTDLEDQSESCSGLGATSEGQPSNGAILAFHTSGSTGAPKCVIYGRAEAGSHAAVVAEVLELDGATTYLALPPPRFAYGLSILHSHLLADVPVTFVASGTELSAAAPLDGRSLAIYALPQHAPLLLSSSLRPDSVERLFIAGGRLSQASAAALARRFPRMRLTNMYGQAEMGPRLATWEGDPLDFVEGMIGTPIPGVDLDVSPDGELLARSDHAMTWSIKPPYTNVEPFTGRHELVRTGDRATRLPDGTFRHDGRADHFLNVAGTKVDVRQITAIVTRVAEPLLVQVHSRPARTGDTVPVVEIVADGQPTVETVTIRRALHAEFGSLAALFDLRYVDTPTVKESGK